MSAPKYTPGSWYFHRESWTVRSPFYGTGSIQPNDSTLMGDCHGIIVAGFQESHGGTIGRPFAAPEAEANARLIAAAPELLDALKQVLAHHGYTEAGPDFPDARAAIRKAEGQS